ncbi:unnamed protein product [Pleuronectes platessa]|uniref:Uncharacterized protein n=1 Tax=Pleuronectes platessa TaxID=8262 RepID=A0A9N7VYH4_PLEPL|nr:unnamed protein product [Pleuronectes platessa]
MKVVRPTVVLYGRHPPSQAMVGLILQPTEADAGGIKPSYEDRHFNLNSGLNISICQALRRNQSPTAPSFLSRSLALLTPTGDSATQSISQDYNIFTLGLCILMV